MSLLLKSSVRQLTNIRLFSTSSLTLKHISNADQLKFKESKEGSKIVLVDFYAEVSVPSFSNDDKEADSACQSGAFLVRSYLRC